MSSVINDSVINDNVINDNVGTTLLFAGRGFVRREAGADGRSTSIVLTQAGRAVASRVSSGCALPARPA